MYNCSINLEQFSFEPRNYFIFYSSDKLIVYKNNNFLVISDCKDNIKYQIKLPNNYKIFESIDLDDCVLFMFSGKEILIVNKDTFESTFYAMEYEKFGIGTTKILPGFSPDEIIFGTQCRGGLQVVSYNFRERCRSAQSMTMKMTKFTDFLLENSKIYAVMDSTYILCLEPSTCETLWKKFETSAITPKVLLNNNQVLYTCQGSIKEISKLDSRTIKIPFIKVSSLENVSDDLIYFTYDDKNNLACYNTKLSTVEWEIKNIGPIKQSFMLNGIFNKNNHEVLLGYNNDNLFLVDLTSKQIVYKSKMNILSMKESGQHILIYKTNGMTDII